MTNRYLYLPLLLLPLLAACREDPSAFQIISCRIDVIQGETSAHVQSLVSCTPADIAHGTGMAEERPYSLNTLYERGWRLIGISNHAGKETFYLERARRQEGNKLWEYLKTLL